MKRQSGLWKHVMAGILLVAFAAMWNVQYHRAQAAKEDSQRRHRHERHRWRDATPEERRAAIASIRGQLDAFRRDDYEKAAFYQSSSLRSLFPSPGAFRRMITTRYPQFARYKTVEFGRARADKEGSYVSVRARLTGRDGVAMRAMYMMVREGEEYRVEGVIGGGLASPEPRNEPTHRL